MSHGSGAGTLPGAFGGFGCCGQTYTRTSYWALSSPDIGVPFTSQFQPLEPFPLSAPRTLTMNMYDPNRRTPYVQNFNLSIQREMANNLILDVSYVGSKGTKLYNRRPMNAVKIRDNQFLQAFNDTRAGLNHPLFDRMLLGLNIPGVGTVNGTTLSGSEALRRYTPTRTSLANGSVGAVADFLNRSTNVTGQAGGFIRNGGLPENFLVFNPQFQDVGINGNLANSTYHSLQVQVTKRLSYGLSAQGSYTWSKNLGITNDDHDLSPRDPDNFRLDKAVLAFHRTRHLLLTVRDEPRCTENGSRMVGPDGGTMAIWFSDPLEFRGSSDALRGRSRQHLAADEQHADNPRGISGRPAQEV